MAESDYPIFRSKKRKVEEENELDNSLLDFPLAENLFPESQPSGCNSSSCGRNFRLDSCRLYLVIKTLKNKNLSEIYFAVFRLFFRLFPPFPPFFPPLGENLALTSFSAFSAFPPKKAKT